MIVQIRVKKKKKGLSEEKLLIILTSFSRVPTGSNICWCYRNSDDYDSPNLTGKVSSMV